MSIEIAVENNTYTSISAAWRALSPPGLPLITVRWRLKNNWNKLDAFKTPRVPAQIRRTFPQIRSKN